MVVGGSLLANTQAAKSCSLVDRNSHSESTKPIII